MKNDFTVYSHRAGERETHSRTFPIIRSEKLPSETTISYEILRLLDSRSPSAQSQQCEMMEWMHSALLFS